MAGIALRQLLLLVLLNITLSQGQKQYLPLFPMPVRMYENDNYVCRIPLGVSYSMFIISSGQPKIKHSDRPPRSADPKYLRRDSKLFNPRLAGLWYANYRDCTKTRQAYLDFTLQFAYKRANITVNMLQQRFSKKFENEPYRSYVQVDFVNLMELDGMTNDGGGKNEYGFWEEAVTRYNVNYTTDGNEWSIFKENNQPKEFLYMEMMLANKEITSGYVQFYPRIVARSVRIVILSYRLLPSLVVEFFGCFYMELNSSGYLLRRVNIQYVRRHCRGPEMEGLQTARGWGFPDLNNLYRYQISDFGYLTKSTFNGPVIHGPSDMPFYSLLARYLNPENLETRLKHFNVDLWYPNGKFVWSGNKWWGPRKSLKSLSPNSKKENDKMTWRTDDAPGQIKLEKSIGRRNFHSNLYLRFFYTPAVGLGRKKGCESPLLSYSGKLCPPTRKAGETHKFEFDLKKVGLVDSFLFKGHPDVLQKSYVETVSIEYSLDKKLWMPLRNRYSREHVYKANKNPEDEAILYLNPRIRARYLRLQPKKGKKSRCFRVAINGCMSEPWLDEINRLKNEAKKTGYRLWHIVLDRRTGLLPVEIECFPKHMKHMKMLSHEEKIYEIILGQDMPWPKGKPFIFEVSRYTRLLKCEAYNKNGELISLQYYVISYIEAGPTGMAVQDVDMLTNGGIPAPRPYPTLWTYEPMIGKITFLHFPAARYTYKVYGTFSEDAFDHFHLTHLGTTDGNTGCMYLAMEHGYKYFTYDTLLKSCAVSWFMPYAKMSQFRRSKTGDRTIYEIRRIYNGYRLTWYQDEYYLAHYAMHKLKFLHPVYEYAPKTSRRYEFRHDACTTQRTYDIHTLVIYNFQPHDAASYKVRCETPSGSYKNVYNLRHYGQPQLRLAPQSGACLGQPLVIRATPIHTEHQTVEESTVTWEKIKGNAHPAAKTMRTADRYELRAKKASVNHRGRYQAKVSNRYGHLLAYTDVEIVTHLPNIAWVTPSPHTAVEDTSDILEAKVSNERELVAIEWTFKGKVITEDERYTFPGALPDMAHTRKILKLNNLAPEMSGDYTVTAKTKYCEFSEKIFVNIYVQPKLIVSPTVRTIYQVAGGNATKIKVVIIGGFPEPQEENLMWYKNTNLLQVSTKGRVKVQHAAWVDDKRKRIGWNSTLSISRPVETDSGTYSFMVSLPKTNYTIERVVKVTKLVTYW